MPSSLIKSFAKRTGKSISKIEGYWDEAKKSASDKGLKKGDPSFYAYTNAIVQKRLGLREGFSFKDFLGANEPDLIK